MVVQIVPAAQKGPSEGNQILESLGNMAQQFMERKNAMAQLRSENEAIKQNFGIDLTGIDQPELRHTILQKAMEFGNKINEQQAKNDLRMQRLASVKQGQGNQFSPQEKDTAIDKAARDLGIDANNEDREWVKNNLQSQEQDPFAEAEQYAAIDEHELAGVAKERGKSAIKKTESAKKETLPLRKEYADHAKYASQGIENKKLASSLLKTGNVDSPEKVYFASLLPGALGNKLLSDETHLYKAGLFDEFGVLKTMFPGQIRVKEIELLEDKLATLDKSHSAKQKILDNGAKKLERDIILAKQARKVEKKFPEASYLEFQQKVQEQAQPELDKLYDDIIKGYDKIYAQYAPDKTNYVDQNGKKYRAVNKKDLEKFLEEGRSQGLELRPI